MRYHVRRADREIKDPGKLDKILKESRYVTVALCMGNRPYLVSLSHIYDEDSRCIYFHCASLGKKMDYMMKNPQVWGQAIIDNGYEDGKCNHLFVTAMFSGTVELVEDIGDKRRILYHLFANQERDKSSGEVDSHFTRIGEDFEVDGVTVGRIVLDEITGKVSGGADY
jgi:nitroimidazol reductase NimA-like FMN-containing flavoprotein (pyridoxamine 5'-phosphate oxidase superfamily)